MYRTTCRQFGIHTSLSPALGVGQSASLIYCKDLDCKGANLWICEEDLCEADEIHLFHRMRKDRMQDFLQYLRTGFLNITYSTESCSMLTGSINHYVFAGSHDASS